MAFRGGRHRGDRGEGRGRGDGGRGRGRGDNRNGGFGHANDDMDMRSPGASDGQPVDLVVSGWQNSAAADNIDGGVNSLKIFIEKKGVKINKVSRTPTRPTSTHATADRARHPKQPGSLCSTSTCQDHPQSQRHQLGQEAHHHHQGARKFRAGVRDRCACWTSASALDAGTQRGVDAISWKPS